MAIVVSESTPERAWVRAVEQLLARAGDAANLLVTMHDPTGSSGTIRARYDKVMLAHGLLSVRHVAYTIFPETLYLRSGRCRGRLFDRYNRPGGVYERVLVGRWGTYFRRMTHQEVASGRRIQIVNQLDELIAMLTERRNVYKAAYFIDLSTPSDSRRTRGGPCLQHVCLQLNPGGEERRLSLLALYRNQNFVQRALGNYVGLGQLQAFLCEETGYTVGDLTCIASHATLDRDTTRRSWPSRATLRELCEWAAHQ